MFLCSENSEDARKVINFFVSPFSVVKVGCNCNFLGRHGRIYKIGIHIPSKANGFQEVPHIPILWDDRMSPAETCKLASTLLETKQWLEDQTGKLWSGSRSFVGVYGRNPKQPHRMYKAIVNKSPINWWVYRISEPSSQLWRVHWFVLKKSALASWKRPPTIVLGACFHTHSMSTNEKASCSKFQEILMQIYKPNTRTVIFRWLLTFLTPSIICISVGTISCLSAY